MKMDWINTNSLHKHWGYSTAAEMGPYNSVNMQSCQRLLVMKGEMIAKLQENLLSYLCQSV